MWQMKVFFSIILIIQISYSTEANTYYFSYNRTSNEYMVRNRAYSNESERYFQPGIRLSELRNNVTRTNNFQVQTHPLIDPEWDYDWKNITRRQLPPYINKYYETFSKNITGSVRFLFNTNPENSTVIKINLKDLNLDGNISEIELHFYQKVDKNLLKNSLILRLYQLENEYFNETSLINPDSHKLLNVIYIYQADNGWQVFKLTKILTDWLKKETKLSLFITVSKPNEEQFSLFRDANRDIFRTFMLLKTLLNVSTDKRISFVENSCRKRELYIDFEKLNWMKFIIAPSGYDAFNCYGTCYSTEKLPNHLKVAKSRPEISRRSLCCVPIKYSSLPLMFYDKNGNVAIKVYNEMIISACGCR